MFRFTIRDVLWLMVVVGILVAWWIDHSELKSNAARRNEWITERLKDTGLQVKLEPLGEDGQRTKGEFGRCRNCSDEQPACRFWTGLYPVVNWYLAMSNQFLTTL